MVNVFDNHCQEANRFIKDLALQLGSPDDTDHAIRILRCVFKALRRRIIPDESLHIISQLPLILKGLYVDGWDINEPLSEAKTFDEFLFDIRNNTETSASVDFANDELARKKITTVFSALKEFVSEGELNHIRDELPKEIAEIV
ncbi:MAG TPA: DUF2267 domain-containing protein [Chitinophagaceae bacterium]|jgi:uncharacterized protein (DUF2267 family)|nr:DUF2267 domain-containing protein [Chitinophagaceae bacterium]